MQYTVKFKQSFGNKANFSEYVNLNRPSFEIQIRTLLENAWASFEHPNYKFKEVKPKKIQRRLLLMSGVLEVVDNEFDIISTEIDKHYDKILKQIKDGKLDSIIDSISLKKYLFNKFEPKFIYTKFEPFYRNDPEIIIKELNNFGIKRIQELEIIIPNNFQKVLEKYNNKLYINEFIRIILLIKNANRYLKEVLKAPWIVIRGESRDILNHYRVPIIRLSERQGISIIPKYRLCIFPGKTRL